MAIFLQYLYLIFGLLMLVSIIIAVVYRLMARYEKDLELQKNKRRIARNFAIVPILTYFVIVILWVVKSAIH